MSDEAKALKAHNDQQTRQKINDIELEKIQDGGFLDSYIQGNQATLYKNQEKILQAIKLLASK